MKKIMVLSERGQNGFIANEKLCDSWPVTRKIPRFFRMFIRMLELIGIPASYLRYGEWKNKVGEYDTIVVFRNAISDFATYPALEYIAKNKNGKLIVWYWNSISNIKDGKEKLALFRKYADEIWSYNQGDCKEYGLLYSTAFYYEFLPAPLGPIQYDVLFVGYAKNRVTQIFELEDSLNAQGLNLFFRTIKTSGFSYTDEQNKRFVHETIPYAELLSLIGKTKALAELNSTNDITLRTLESLFFRKKLITNVPTIKGYDFYNPNNIFILGQDDLSQISQFINSSYEDVDHKIIERYTFKTWLENLSGEKLKGEMD